ncbi:ycf3-interacting protein 1, chloroplastic [Mercurialis annua]|uniref:ycf3-interacting protein 1, chloroplastic n=1 Tax=Mercurialis annua TaxID=3986 RepID=UPI00215DF065|nr:ycf3-interacting protein 1, chloroplastic [Mercurialis annua]
MMTMALQLHHFPLLYSSSSYSVDTRFHFGYYNHQKLCSRTRLSSLCLHGNSNGRWRRKRKKSGLFVGREDIELRVLDDEDDEEDEDEDEEDAPPPSPEELQYIEEIKRVLNLLKKNRDMMFNEVKLTIAIEDPREVERRRLLGIEDLDAPTREDLAEALEQVNEGKVPRNRVALKMLAEEMTVWPNLEVEIKKTKPKKSLYAKVTDIGVDPREAAKRLNVDWDSAAEIEEVDKSNETEVPAVLGYGALYLVSAFPVIIGISVVLILFYNSLQ